MIGTWEPMALVALWGLAWAGASETAPRVVPAVNEVEPAEQPGERPEVAERAEALGRTWQVDFQDLSGWTLEVYGDCEATLARSRAERLFHDTSAKWTFRGTGPEARCVIRPSQPISLTEPFDAVDLWIRGYDWQWPPDPSLPHFVAILHLEDSHGQDHALTLGPVDARFWMLIHRPLYRTEEDPFRPPLKLTAIELPNCETKQERTIYLGALSFYTRRPGTYRYRRPERLPFPTTEDTILPTLSSPPLRRGGRGGELKNTLRQEGSRYLLDCTTDAGTVTYVYTPETGTLSDLRVELPGGRSCTPLREGGPAAYYGDSLLGAEAPQLRRRLLACSTEGLTVTTQWELSRPSAGEDPSLRYTLALTVKQKSLLLDFSSDDPRVADLRLGYFQGEKPCKLIEVPYLTFSMMQEWLGHLWSTPELAQREGTRAPSPQIIYCDGYFVSAFVDWYRSEASALYSRVHRLSEQAAYYNGGALYNALLDGRRNPLRERVFLTISEDFHEVLPNIPNPPSPMGAVTRSKLWITMSPLTQIVDHCRQMRAMGIEELIITGHEGDWKLETGGYMRTEGDPQKGGDAALREAISQLHALGYTIGLYTNYVTVASNARQFAELPMVRDQQGNYISCWWRTFVPNPGEALLIEQEHAPLLARKFGATASYCDVATHFNPWCLTDYSPESPGAGRFWAAYEALGRMFLNEKRAYGGPVYSEGKNHWLYAGLTDGNYAQLRGGGNDTLPNLVDFDLLKIHPLQADIGMGDTAMYFDSGPAASEPWTARDWKLDRFLAATAIYGHAGLLVMLGNDIMLKSYYLIQQLQSHYVLEPVEDIRYHADGRFHSPSEAVANDAYQQGHIYVRYRNGCEVWANLNREEPWTIDFGGQPLVLPPHSFAARADGARPLIEYSALKDGHRVDYVASPAYVYVDARGTLTTFPEVQTDGAVAIRLRAPGTVEVLSIDASAIRLNWRHYFPQGSAQGIQSLAVMDLNDRAVRGIPFQQDGDWLVLDGLQPLKRVRIPGPRIKISLEET